MKVWILAMAGAAAISAMATAIAPEGRTKDVLRLVCGCVMALSFISPLGELDYAAYSRGLSYYSLSREDITDIAERGTRELTRTIIEERCEAYILDKAAGLGAGVLSAEVRLKWSPDEGCWYPWEAGVVLEGGETGREALRLAIGAELGIPAERQYWSGYGD